MAAPKGNKFWENRSKHGKDKLFNYPDLLWDAACEYFDWCVENPFLSLEQSRGGRTRKEKELTEDGIEDVDTGLIEIPKMRAFTLGGLCIYLGCSENYFRNFESNNKNADDYMAVITRIKQVIREQKFTGAASGFFQHNIIARDLGLTDKKDLTTDGKPFDISGAVDLFFNNDNTESEEEKD